MEESLKPCVVPISELALVCLGYSPQPKERRQDGKYLLLGGRNIKDGRLVPTDKDSYIDDIPKNSFRRAIAQSGDIIVSTLFDRRKLYIYKSTDPRAVVNSSCAIIRAPNNNDYIISYLRTLKGQKQFLRDTSAATSGAFIPRLSIGSLSKIEVPLLPLKELQRLGDDHIESSTTDDLIKLRDELQSIDDIIVSKVAEQLKYSLREDDQFMLLPMEIDERESTADEAVVAEDDGADDLDRLELDDLPSDSDLDLSDVRIADREDVNLDIDLECEIPEPMEILSGEDKEIQKLKARHNQVIIYYEDRIKRINAQISTNDLKRRIAHGETSELEFKSSLRWNLKSKRDDKNLQLAVLKTIAAFCNTQGGELLIGVADDKTILGIDHDHFSNEDKFLLHLGNLITDKIIPNVSPSYVDYGIETIDDKKICQVVCKQSKEDVWLKADKNKPEAFYVRSGPESREMPPREAFRYIRERFKK
jgi:hypothetical protein